MLKLLKKLYFPITIILLIWFLISYVEILYKNVALNPIYSNYNLIVMITK